MLKRCIVINKNQNHYIDDCKYNVFGWDFWVSFISKIGRCFTQSFKFPLKSKSIVTAMFSSKIVSCIRHIRPLSSAYLILCERLNQLFIEIKNYIHQEHENNSNSNKSYDLQIYSVNWCLITFIKPYFRCKHVYLHNYKINNILKSKKQLFVSKLRKFIRNIHIVKRRNVHVNLLLNSRLIKVDLWKLIVHSKVLNVKILLILTLLNLNTFHNAEAKCTGRFVNPITDICWECLFPVSIGSISLFSGKNPDTDNPASPICMCGSPVPRVGIAAGFWEPVRLVDVTKRPFCFPNLGGIEFDPGIKIGTGSAPRSTGSGVGSWQVHWYIYPLIYWLELLTDFLCLEQASFDVAYITELDPMWGDDSLTFILNPEAILFANPIAQAACAADCVASSTGLPMDSLFWCGGCQGSMYPLDGNIQGHIGSIQSALLATERMAFKLHREMVAWGTSGSEGLCQKYPMPIMKKSQYRSQLTVPVPSDCYPFGRSTTIYESGKEIPVIGEDFGFLIWRKRTCCVSAM